MSTVTWPKLESVTFFGRNGTTFCCGVTIYHMPSPGQLGRVMLTPHTSRGEPSKACDLDLPAEPGVLRSLAGQLQKIANAIEDAEPDRKIQLTVGRAATGLVEFVGIAHNDKEKAA